MFGLFDWIKEKFLNKYARSLIRGLSRSIGGYLAGIGVASPEIVDSFTGSFEQVALGLVMMIVPQITSFMDKKNNQK